jgi:5-(carboxyamino)imidazole ribonucleotide mutase
MGSQSDWATMRHAAETLAALGVSLRQRIVSAHRTPERLYDFAKGAKAAGFKVIIAGAGGAAHLPGMTAALTPCRCSAFPVESKALSGVDAALDRADAGRHSRSARSPSASAGAINAALLAAAMLALNDPALSPALDDWRAGRPTPVAEDQPTDASVSAPPIPIGRAPPIGILGGGQLGRMLAIAAAGSAALPYLRARARFPAFDVAAPRPRGL